MCPLQDFDFFFSPAPLRADVTNEAVGSTPRGHNDRGGKEDKWFSDNDISMQKAHVPCISLEIFAPDKKM